MQLSILVALGGCFILTKRDVCEHDLEVLGPEELSEECRDFLGIEDEYVRGGILPTDTGSSLDTDLEHTGTLVTTGESGDTGDTGLVVTIDLATTDNDNDGYCETDCSDGSLPGDCDDTRAGVSPVDPEICDGLDNDCEGGIDEGLDQIWYQDSDGDGFGDPSVNSLSCAAPLNFVSNDVDCDDGNIFVNPDEPEVCDGLDQDCIYGADNGLVYTQYCFDADLDGFGNADDTQLACSQPLGYIFECSDCDDSNLNTYPGTAPNDDPGECFKDDDLDDYGDSYDGTVPDGVTLGSDCHDGDPLIHPGVVEVIANGIDDDCDVGTPDLDNHLCVTVSPAVSGTVTYYILQTITDNATYWVSATDVPVTGTPFMSGDAVNEVCGDLSGVPYSTGDTVIVLGVWNNGSEVSLVNGNASLGYTTDFLDIVVDGALLACFPTMNVGAAPYPYMSCDMP